MGFVCVAQNCRTVASFYLSGVRQVVTKFVFIIKHTLMVEGFQLLTYKRKVRNSVAKRVMFEWVWFAQNCRTVALFYLSGVRQVVTKLFSSSNQHTRNAPKNVDVRYLLISSESISIGLAYRAFTSPPSLRSCSARSLACCFSSSV